MTDINQVSCSQAFLSNQDKTNLLLLDNSSCFSPVHAGHDVGLIAEFLFLLAGQDQNPSPPEQFPFLHNAILIRGPISKSRDPSAAACISSDVAAVCLEQQILSFSDQRAFLNQSSLSCISCFLIHPEKMDSLNPHCANLASPGSWNFALSMYGQFSSSIDIFRRNAIAKQE